MAKAAVAAQPLNDIYQQRPWPHHSKSPKEQGLIGHFVVPAKGGSCSCSQSRTWAVAVCTVIWKGHRLMTRHCRGRLTQRRAAGTQTAFRLGFFSDAKFKPLRDQFVASIKDTPLELCEAVTEDLQANAYRAAGGKSVYVFKLNHLLEVLRSASEGEYVLYSDVDVQFLQKALPSIETSMHHVDMCFQREFVDIGVNIGFMALRRSSSVESFWEEVLAIVSKTGGFDQRIVNDFLYSKPPAELGLQWKRLPCEFWASSQALDGSPPPQDLLLHHANWVTRDEFAPEKRGPEPKIAQLQELRNIVAAKKDAELQRLTADLTRDGSLETYKRRFYGDKRIGPEWSQLPVDHPTRPERSRPPRSKRKATFFAAAG